MCLDSEKDVCIEIVYTLNTALQYNWLYLYSYHSWFVKLSLGLTS